MSVASGQKPTSAELNALASNIVAEQYRTTNLAGLNTTETRVISTRGAMVDGRSYAVEAQVEYAGPTGVVGVECWIRHTTNDTEPTTASTAIARGEGPPSAAASIPVTIRFGDVFQCTSSGFLRVCLSVVRNAGAGNFDINAAAGRRGWIRIIDVGPSVVATGTVYT